MKKNLLSAFGYLLSALAPRRCFLLSALACRAPCIGTKPENGGHRRQLCAQPPRTC
ncbi:MAG: hypothetical protein J5971_04745 [Prevotella sp.]|nr:hypothetical protein [Prevotella sp.]